MKLSERIQVFNHWTDDYISASISLRPMEKPVIGYEQGEVLTFKMMASFSLELMFKTYCLILLLKDKGDIDFNDDNHFIGFMRQNQLLNHKLTELLIKIRKNDSDFDVEYITETIDFYDRFLESRYPYSNGNNHDDIFQFNKSNYIKYDDLRQLLREKIKSNIRLF